MHIHEKIELSSGGNSRNDHLLVSASKNISSRNSNKYDLMLGSAKKNFETISTQYKIELEKIGPKKSTRAGGAGETTDIWKLAMSQANMLNQYYAEALDQANKTFYFALFLAIIGCGIFFAGVALIYWDKQYASIALISGPVVEVVSGVAISFHEKKLPALVDNSNKMDRMQRYMLAYSLAEKLNDPQKEIALVDLIKAIGTSEKSIS